MKLANFYNSSLYKEKQSALATANWQRGVYDFLRKQEQRQCSRVECRKTFQVQQSSKKKFCSCSCAIRVSNSKRSNINSRMKKEIEKLYKSGLSMAEISDKIGLGYGKIVYCMQKFNIPRRSMSEATYVKRNPEGDPFRIKKIKAKKDIELFNLAIGLFLGEGDKKSIHSVKLANSDPKILGIFLRFLREICNVDESKIRAELNIFDDVSTENALDFWQKATKLQKLQFRSLIVRPANKKGTYKSKSLYGTLSIYVSNSKLKRIIDGWCEMAVI